MEQRSCCVEPLLPICQQEHLDGLAQDPENGDDVVAYHHKVICTAQHGGNDEHERYVRKS